MRTSRSTRMPFSDFRELSLKRTNINGQCPADDFEVFKDGRPVGCIMRHPQAPEGQPWFWTITAREQPPSVYNRGYAATREQAMADFKARWMTP